jgi:DNA-binding NtrC family response regulator
MQQPICNILIVDDDINIVKLIELNLISPHYRIAHARNGQQAIASIKNKNFDLILVDLMMPDMDGLSLIKSIKPDLPTHTLVLLLTAHVLEQYLMEAVQSGVYDIIQKPFTANRLKLTIRNAWNYKKLLDKCQESDKKT